MKKKVVKPQCVNGKMVRPLNLRKRNKRNTSIPMIWGAGEEEGQYFVTLDLRVIGEEPHTYEYRSTPEKAELDASRCILSNLSVTLDDGRLISLLELIEMGH